MVTAIGSMPKRSVCSGSISKESSADTNGNIDVVMARPASRLTPPRRSLRALDPESTKRSPWVSMRRCTSSSNSGTF